MSHLKTMIHKFFRNPCQRSQQELLRNWKTVAKVKGGVWSSQCLKFFNEQLSNIKTLGMQCNVIAAHRARRTVQIMQLYNRLYGNKPASHVLKSLRDLMLKFNTKDKMFFLLGAALFDWKKNRVTDREMEIVEEELKPFFECKTSEPTYRDQAGEVWEKLVDKEHFKLWRCPVKGSSLYKYKAYGTYSDVPATAFFNIQLDLNYRKQWDSHVIWIETVDTDEETGSEVVYWATHFPLGFLYNRDYLFVRRFKVDEEKKLMMLSAKGVDHPSFPVTSDFVRVNDYMSQMLIRPHTTFDENGFDYIMYYFDNPQLYVPTWAINKMTVQSLPAFIDQIHTATVNLVKSNVHISGYHSSNTNTNSGSSYLHSKAVPISQMS